MFGMGIGFWIITLACAALGGLASMGVKRAFRKYSQIGTRSGLSGADVARTILRNHGIHDVSVERVAGKLTDHYDPRAKALRLSEPVHDGRSMAAFGVAAHEVGHAIQHAEAYGLLKFRSAWVPMASIGSSMSMFVLIAALFIGAASPFGTLVAWLGVGLFACTTLFTLVTVPVEFDASRRAMLALDQGGLVTGEEYAGARKVLNAAALTYVAALIASLAQLMYWMHVLGLLGGRDE